MPGWLGCDESMCFGVCATLEVANALASRLSLHFLGAFYAETRHSPSLSVYSLPTSHADFIAARGLRQLTAASLQW